MSMGYRKSAAEILEDAQVGSRPGYFGGRGVTTSDLDGTKLQRCHEEIRVAHGVEAAAAFVDMVASLDRMTATGFINSVYALESHGWVHIPGDRVNHIAPDGQGQAFATVVDTFGRHMEGDGRRRQEMAADYEIRRGFLEAHGYTDRSGVARHCYHRFFITDASAFLPSDMYGGEPDGLWHVTVARDAVVANGLRSRSQLGGAVQGLGGGHDNQAPDLVSLTWCSGKASDIEDTLRVAALAARDEIPASGIFWGTAQRYGTGSGTVRG